MILPIYALGYPVLKKKAKDIEQVDEEIITLITNMWETMYNANGIGLAAPQVGKSLRLFLVDTEQMMDDDKDLIGVKKAFINATIIKEFDDPFDYEEGCLSIPDIRGNVRRHSKITIEYQDTDGKVITEDYDGINARVIQHEYDHIEGKLFVDYLKPLKKRRIARKLDKIAKGEISVSYRMKFNN